MDHSLFRYDEPYGRPQRKANLFGWTIAILLLSGMALAAWLGSFYIFGQPERPDSYRILQKLHKIEQPKRFQLTAAPAGEFLNAKQLYERYSGMGPAELARKNAELARNYIRNYEQVAGLVPYVVGRFSIMEARALGKDDLFTSGVAALTNAVDYGALLLEHVYPSDEQPVPLMKQTLATGLELKLDRAHDLSAVVHAQRLPDGRVLVTVVPLLYGTYTVTQGRGTFSLEPPFALNMAAGWPLFKDSVRRKAEIHYAAYRQKIAPPVQGISVPGLGPAPGPALATNELVRVESALRAEPSPATSVTPSPAAVAKASPTPKGRALAKNSRPSATPAAAASPTPIALAALTPAPSAPPTASVAPSETPLAAQPVTSDTTLASTAGGGSWKTYPAGRMPKGRLITTSDLADVGEHGLAGERVYLRGQFVVNFAESNRAVLRPKSRIAESVLRLGAPSSTRVIVEFPSGSKIPAQGETVTRDEARPYEITEVRKQSDGQLNVFVREIMQ
ncbi:MAG TPA: hypothetical protein VK474_07240 [Chthoniobacterales bacterium]|nr:hypothetical protein [Chthoniobacterales bacterium]